MRHTVNRFSFYALVIFFFSLPWQDIVKLPGSNVFFRFTSRWLDPRHCRFRRHSSAWHPETTSSGGHDRTYSDVRVVGRLRQLMEWRRP